MFMAARAVMFVNLIFNIDLPELDEFLARLVARLQTFLDTYG